METNRAELIKEIEDIFEKRVFAIVFNPNYEEGLKNGDEIYFAHFIEQIIKKENIKDCVLILNGFGGNLKTAILCSQLLRNSLKKYSVFIPTVACSSICYLVLQSDKLYIGERSILTQIDPIFNYDGEELRAIKRLNDPNPSVRTIAQNYYNPIFENIKTIIQNKPHVFNEEVSKRSKKNTDYLIKLIDIWLGKELHESGLKIKDLERLKVNYDILNHEVIEKAKTLIKLCLKELVEENQRFIIQTNKIEEEYFGGFFYP
jgi:hypothetical protein